MKILAPTQTNGNAKIFENLKSSDKENSNTGTERYRNVKITLLVRILVDKGS